MKRDYDFFRLIEEKVNLDSEILFGILGTPHFNYSSEQTMSFLIYVMFLLACTGEAQVRRLSVMLCYLGKETICDVMLSR